MRRLVLVLSVASAISGVAVGLAAPADPAARYSGLAWRLIGPFTGGAVTGVSGTAGEPGEYVVATAAGAFATNDGGTTWAPTEAARPTGSRWTDPADPARVVDLDAAGIRVSLDGGATWTTHHNLPIASVAYTKEIDGTPGGSYAIVAFIPDGGMGERVELESGPGIPAIAGSSPGRVTRPTPPAHAPIDGQAVHAFSADPVEPRLQFAGTATGVSVSVDAGAHWRSLQLNLPTVPINSLDVHRDDLIAATDGRSVWILDDISPLRALARAPERAPVELFPPAPVTLDAVGHPAGRGVDLDYYLADASAEPVTLDILDRAGTRMLTLSSGVSTDADPWTPIRTPLATSAGGHRVVWNLRLDPPPAPSNRYRHLAPALFASDRSDAPAGPTVLAGTYQVRLTVGSHVATASLVIRPAPGAPAAVGSALLARFDLARHLADALDHADEDARRLRRLRAAVKTLTTAANPEVAQAATDLASRLSDLDGSDWKFVLPDADTDNDLDYYDKDLYEEILPVAAAVSLTKDYDDPTTIIGSNFQNSNHPPAFAPVGDTLAALLARVESEPGAPPPALLTDVTGADTELAAARASWQAILVKDLPAFNQLLVAHGLAPIRPPAAAS